MAHKAVVFTTSLSVDECADTFRHGAGRARGLNARFSEVVARAGGSRRLTGFYTPAHAPPFAFACGAAPAIALGINILGPMYGSDGPSVPLHMYVGERRDRRDVQIVASHGRAGGTRAARLAIRIFEHFREADPGLRVTDGKL